MAPLPLTSMACDDERDIASARPLFGLGLCMILFWLFIAFLLASCATKPKPTPAVNLAPSLERVRIIGDRNDLARSILAEASGHADSAKAEALAASSLVQRMEREASPYAEEVEQLRLSYEEHITLLQEHIHQTNQLLSDQSTDLFMAKNELEAAQQASDASEKEKEELRSLVTTLQNKYEALKKYRWAVLFIGIWLVIKAAGHFGSWSPQGRIAKFLVG